MNIDELRAYHPDHPARPTIYEWVGKKAIPVHKDGKKLRFLRSEIDEWLNSGRAKTHAELDSAFTPESAVEIGMLTIKTANQTVEDAAMRPGLQSGNAGPRTTSVAEKVVNYGTGNQKSPTEAGL